jgi:hypothetical protein
MAPRKRKRAKTARTASKAGKSPKPKTPARQPVRKRAKALRRAAGGPVPAAAMPAAFQRALAPGDRVILLERISRFTPGCEGVVVSTSAGAVTVRIDRQPDCSPEAFVLAGQEEAKFALGTKCG